MKINSKLLLWIAITTAVSILLLIEFNRGVSIETNILKLLPTPEQDHVVDDAITSLSERLSSDMIFLVKSSNDTTTVALAKEFSKTLNSSNLFNEITSTTSKNDETEWFNYFFPRRYSLLTKQNIVILKGDNPSEDMYQKLLRELYSPMPDLYGQGLNSDPLLLFSDFIKNISAENSDVQNIDGIPIFNSNDSSYALIIAPLKNNPFSPIFQEAVEEFVISSKESLLSKNSELLALGIVRFARAGFKQGKKEASYIGTISIVAVLILLFSVFKSFKSVVIGTIPLIAAFLYALAGTLLFSNKIHLISITMGACLTGVAVDYSFHYLSEYIFNRNSWNSKVALQHIFSGITIGIITTAIGYFTFLFTPLPGLKQIALFTIFGLIGAYLTVILLFPALLNTPSNKALPENVFLLIARLKNLADRFSNNRFTLPIIIIMLALFSLLLKKNISFDDSLYQLKATTKNLDDEEKRVKNVVSDFEANRFIVVSAKTEEGVLSLLQKDANILDSLIEKNILSGYQSISTFTASEKKVKENINLLQNLIDSTNFTTKLLEIGFRPNAVNTLKKDCHNVYRNKTTIKSWINSPVSKHLRHLWIGKKGSNYIAVIMLKNITDEAVLSSFFNDSSSHYINRVNNISNLLKTYRTTAIRVVVFAYFIIWLLLTIRYRFIGALKVIAPPLLGGIIALNIASLFSSLNLMHILALLLVLGVGIDYTIFFAESKNRDGSTILAVILSAITTILSFGVLILSTTAALKAIGIIILPGITVALILSPISSNIIHKKS